MRAEVTRIINVAATSAAISPSGNFIAYSTTDGVYVDDGKPRRLLEMLSKALPLKVGRVLRGKWSMVYGVTDDGVAMFATTSQAGVVGLDGQVRDLLGPTSGHRPYLCYNAHDRVLTVLCDTTITQFDTTTWAVLRKIELGEELDCPRFHHCSADGDWIIAQSAGYIAVIGADGFECVLPAAKRFHAIVGAGRLVAAWNSSEAKTTVTRLPSDSDPQVWEGVARAWCPLAREFRGTVDWGSGAPLIWTPDGTATAVEVAPSERDYRFSAVDFSPGVRCAVRYSPNHHHVGRRIEVLHWN